MGKGGNAKGYFPGVILSEGVMPWGYQGEIQEGGMGAYQKGE